MAERSPLHRLSGPVGDWIFAVALVSFLGWAVLFVADEPSERFEGIGMIVAVVIHATVHSPRRRWAHEVGGTRTAESLPTWHRRVAPVVLAAGVACLVAFAVLGQWLAAVFVAIGVGGGWLALVAHPQEPTGGRRRGNGAAALVVLAVCAAALFVTVFAGLWGSAVFLALALVVVGVAVTVDSRANETPDGRAPSTLP